MKILKFAFGVFGFFIVLGILSSMFRGCGKSSSQSGYTKKPIDNIIRNLNDADVESYSILLYDMAAEGSFVQTYKHKYQVIYEDSTGMQEETTEWHEVPEDYFKKHEQHMGMTIASKARGEDVEKKVSPPGYNNYVGNDRYGKWRSRSDGSSFWEFYGKYAMLSSVLNMGHNPIRRSYYNDYTSHYNSGRTYYGPSGNRMYGTGGSFTNRYNKSANWSARKSSSFKEKVRNRVSSSSKRSKSSGRYSSSRSSGSLRSRSSGFGK